MKPRLLDLFCGAGGAAMGYYRAGFEVVGVDIKPQPHYPFEFHQADALIYPLEGFDAYHASPPCQLYSRAGTQWRGQGKEYPDLINDTRTMLIATGKPYVIENVPDAPLINPTKLNGALFGMLVRRVRLFETSFNMPLVICPKEKAAHFRKMGRPVKEGEIITPVGHFSNVPYAKRQMGIDWMTGQELTQAIPPAYTEYIGKYLMEYISTLKEE
jgi:DNA (cytosine-5)-methyltransferase 1